MMLESAITNFFHAALRMVSTDLGLAAITAVALICRIAFNRMRN